MPYTPGEMNLRHIEIFHAVYVNGSVSAAARALNVSQPSVSKMLRHAESLLGFQLFQRTSGGLVPTEDAHILFAEVREIQDRVHALREAGRQPSPRDRRDACGSRRCLRSRSTRIPTAVARFLRTHENVKFDLQTVHHDDLLRKLHERETDIAIAYQVPPAAPIAPALGRRGRAGRALPRGGHARRAALHRAARLQGKKFISLAASGPTGGSSPRSCSG